MHKNTRIKTDINSQKEKHTYRTCFDDDGLGFKAAIVAHGSKVSSYMQAPIQQNQIPDITKCFKAYKNRR